MFYEVIFDLETKTFFNRGQTFNPAKFGVSIVSLYRRTLDETFTEVRGELLSFWEKELDKMWKIFEESDRIVGFNSLGFDVPALSPYAPAHFLKLPHFDILAKIKETGAKRVSLNALAKETLGLQKLDSGENAVIYWQKGDTESLAKLKKYCEYDVIITKDVYDFGLRNRILKFKDFWNNPREVKVDFSYPKDISPKAQTSLF